MPYLPFHCLSGGFTYLTALSRNCQHGCDLDAQFEFKCKIQRSFAANVLILGN
jgi:hypothetical protein